MTWTLSCCSPRLKSGVGLGPRNDLIPVGLRSPVIYKFSRVGYSACYIGDTNRHFATRIREHLASDKHSHIFKHLRGSENCPALFAQKIVLKSLTLLPQASN